MKYASTEYTIFYIKNDCSVNSWIAFRSNGSTWAKMELKENPASRILIVLVVILKVISLMIFRTCTVVDISK